MSINDVTAAFGDWLEPLTGVRTVVSMINGRRVVDSSATLSFEGVVQDAGSKETQTLPDGLRSGRVLKIHTVTELIEADEARGIIADVIEYDGRNWRVAQVFNRRIGGYYKILAVRL